jgi:hypothetical protein
VLKGCLHGETVACGLGLGRPGHPASQRNLACVLLVSLSSLISISAGFVLGRRGHAGVTDRVVPGFCLFVGMRRVSSVR